MTTVSTGASVGEIAQLRQRVDQMEAEIRELKQALRARSDSEAKPWWEAIAGKYDGDPFFEQMVVEGRKWRESQRPKARAKSSKVRTKRARS